METEGDKSNAMQYSQQQAEEWEQMEHVHQVIVQTGGQPGWPSPGCREVGGWGAACEPLLWCHPEHVAGGDRYLGGVGGCWKSQYDFTWSCGGEGGKARFLPVLLQYCTFSAFLRERSSYMGDSLVFGAELQMINCIKKKKQCLLAELCNGLYINLREILCGITVASQEFSCRSQEEDGSPANRRSGRWSGSCLPRPGGEPNHSYSSIVMRNGKCIQHWIFFLSWSLLLWI